MSAYTIGRLLPLQEPINKDLQTQMITTNFWIKFKILTNFVVLPFEHEHNSLMPHQLILHKCEVVGVGICPQIIFDILDLQ